MLAQIAEAVKEADKDGEGSIEWTEFLEYMAGKMVDPKNISAEIEMAFEVLISMCSVERIEAISKLTNRGPESAIELFKSGTSRLAVQPAAASEAPPPQQSPKGGWKTAGGAAMATAKLKAAATPPADEEPAAGSSSGQGSSSTVDAAIAVLAPAPASAPTASREASRGSFLFQRRPSVLKRAEQKKEHDRAEKLKQSLFRMGTKPLEVKARDETQLDCALLRLILTDAGNPFSPEEIDRLMAMADPDGDGRVSFDQLRGLACWRNEEDEKAAKVAAERSEMVERAAASSSGQVLPPTAPGTQLVVYATVPEGAGPGDVLCVETPEGTLQAVIPEGCGVGSTFGIVEGKSGGGGSGSGSPTAASKSKEGRV